MINKIIMLNARKEYKEDYEKLCKSKLAEITQKLQSKTKKQKNRTATPTHTFSPKKSNGRTLFKSAVQKTAKKMEKSGEYLNYTIKTEEDTITA